jgi:hypothetical protein
MACMNLWTGSQGFHVPFLYHFAVFLFTDLVTLVEGLDPTICLRTWLEVVWYRKFVGLSLSHGMVYLEWRYVNCMGL